MRKAIITTSDFGPGEKLDISAIKDPEELFMKFEKYDEILVSDIYKVYLKIVESLNFTSYLDDAGADEDGKIDDEALTNIGAKAIEVLHYFSKKLMNDNKEKYIRQGIFASRSRFFISNSNFSKFVDMYKLGPKKVKDDDYATFLNDLFLSNFKLTKVDEELSPETLPLYLDRVISQYDVFII